MFNRQPTVNHELSEFGAYSMSFPFLSFADFLGNVYVVNLFDKNTMYRIPVEQNRKLMNDCSRSDLKICCTCITPNNRLYVLTYKSQGYSLYKIDLLSKCSNFNVQRFEQLMQK